MKRESNKLNLFNSKKEFIIFFVLIIVIFLINLYQEYRVYKKVISHKYCQTDAIVKKQYRKIKNSKKYFVLLIQSKDGYKFYTTNYEDIKDLTNRDITITFLTNKIDFLSFIKGFYAPSFNILVYEKEDVFKDKLALYISKQHEDKELQSLFLALFLAKPISKFLRVKISNLGISHLIAISGFHLSVLFFILYFILQKIYIYFQSHYFPYRNREFDLTVFVFIMLSFYVYIIGFIPSVVRSFVMMSFAFYLYHRHFKILSFEVLFVSVMFILSFNISFLFSIGFWFSVLGVFYIYLFLQYYSYLKKWQIFLFLNFWVYFAMSVIVHFFFSNFTEYQLLSPFLTMMFTLFYPLEMFLHLINHGDILDGTVLKLLSLNMHIYELSIPFWFFVSYVCISLFAVFYKVGIYFILLFDLLQFVFI